MATKTIVTCDICGQNLNAVTHDIKILKNRKWYNIHGVISYNEKDFFELDVCESCAKEMINYIKERKNK